MAHVFVIPFILYLLGTSFIARFGDGAYPVAYSVVVLLTALVTAWLLKNQIAVRNNDSRAAQPILRLHRRILPGISVGLLGIALWIFVSDLQIEQWVAQYLPSFLQPQERVGYNPFEELGVGLSGWAFIAVRLVGIAILVPIAEELFWRGFLLRWLIDPDWEKIPLGEYTHSSCAIVTLMFTLAHPEWLAAAVYCLLINGLLYWKKDLWQCIVAHATSNFVLAVYVLCTGEWWLW